jgi:hypothetical protein
VELGCNIHGHMQGFIVVTHTADIGQTDADGRVTLLLENPHPDHPETAAGTGYGRHAAPTATTVSGTLMTGIARLGFRGRRIAAMATLVILVSLVSGWPKKFCTPDRFGAVSPERHRPGFRFPVSGCLPQIRHYGERSYELLMVPVKASGLRAWLVAGFALDQELANAIERLSGSSVVFRARSTYQQPFRIFAGSQGCGHEAEEELAGTSCITDTTSPALSTSVTATRPRSATPPPEPDLRASGR